MSSLAAWSYTSKATHWPLTGRDDRTRVAAYGPGVVFDCDYKADTKTITDAQGKTVATSQVIYTERATIKAGDRVLIGSHAGKTALDAGAWEVRSVARLADTFEQTADDFEVRT